MGRRDLPSGTVTFLFTDVEGSTRLLHDLGADAYADALAEHRRILRDAFAGHGGIEVDTEGDAIFAAFATAADALGAAGDAQAGLHPGPVRVRMGLHTGTPLRTDEGYVGIDVHRAARIAACGHGRQVLVSATTAALLTGAGDDLVLTDLGEHRLKDLTAPERIYQLGTEQHPPLKTLSPSNLPEPAAPIIGRSAELVEVGELLRDPVVRLVTLTGPGGVGKTRLALEAAAAEASRFGDGRWWVPLASVRDPTLAVAVIGQALGLPEGADASTIRTHLSGRRVLLVLDNAEHLLPGVADVVADLLPASGGSAALVTSREPLHLDAERIVRVPALSETDAERLLVARAAALGVTVPPSEALTRSFIASIACRSRSSWRPRGCRSCPSSRCSSGCHSGSISRRPRATPTRGNGRCGRRWNGATICSPSRSARSSAGSRSSSVAARSRRLRRSAVQRLTSSPRSSIAR